MTKSQCAAFLILLAIAGGAQAASLQRFTTESGETRDALPQVLIKYKPGRATAGRSAVIGGPKVREIRKIGVDVVPVPAGESLQSFVARLKNDPNIEFAEPNGVLRKLDTPNDPAFSSQYYLNDVTSHIQSAWDVVINSGLTVHITTVAVIDTGAALTHDDLQNQFWVNPSSSGNSGLHGTQLLIDWNGDGDGLDTDPDLGTEQVASPDPEDDNTGEFHGTRVAGIIGAETNNALNIAGVSRWCRLMIIKALTADGVGDFAAVAEGITYAVDNGAKVINMSLGGAFGSAAVLSAVAYANTNNVVVVAASGNSGDAVNFPASIDSVIAVGATTASNTLAAFSCTGPSLDLVAPGVGILSTIPVDATSTTGGGGNDGTSFSSPIVAGVAALIRSLVPTMSVANVTKYINFTATDLGASGPDIAYGHGLVNAAAAVNAAIGGTALASYSGEGKTNLYPNPFNPLEVAQATFALPRTLGEDGIEIKIYNGAGELVKTLTGTKFWDGKNDDGSLLAPGIYFYFAKTSRGDVNGKLTIKQ